MEYKDNVIYRPEVSLEFDDEPSLGHLIYKNLMKAGDKTMIVCGLTGKKLSAIELVEKSVEVAKALLAAGIKQGDVVSIITENRFEFAYVLFGTFFLNCILAPLNHTYSEREINHALHLSKPKFIFASDAVSKSVLNVVKPLSFVKNVILLDDDDKSRSNVTVYYNDFIKSKAIRKMNFELKPVDTLTTVCLIMCSSGTTGLPKGVQLSQSNIIVTARAAKNNILSGDKVGGEETVILGLLPLFHVFGAAVFTCAMATASAKVVLLPKFEEDTFLRGIQDYRCNSLFLVPPLMVFFAKNEKIDQYDLSSIRFMLSGAAPLAKETEQAVRDRLKIPNLLIIQGYGMSELTVGVLSQKDILKPGSVGDANAGVYAKVVDENGNSLGPNQRGELCFKGTCMMVGYIGDQQATSSMIDSDGWLHTGDVGYYDEDLQFFIVDRIKELIKWKGFQVPPAEIEALLLTHQMISDCGVIGKPDEEAGELPLAFVVKSDESLTEAEVKAFVHGKTSKAKRLHGGVIFVDEIPKNPSGKILRRELRDLLKKFELKSKL